MILGFWSAGGVLWMGVRAWKILDRPLIHANLSQSHSVFFARLHSANRRAFAIATRDVTISHVEVSEEIEMRLA